MYLLSKYVAPAAPGPDTDPGRPGAVEEGRTRGGRFAQRGRRAGRGCAVGAGTRHREHHRPGRGRQVQLRLSEEEYAALARAAERAGLTATGYAAAAAVAAAMGTAPPSTSPLREALAEVMQARTQVRRFAVNVNQVAAALNSGGAAPEWTERAVAATVVAVARLDTAADALARRLA